MHREIIDVSPMVLPKSCGLARAVPRPIELRQENYEEEFDYYTLIFDAFQYCNYIVAVGPPLLNLARSAAKAKYHLRGGRAEANFVDMNRVSIWTFMERAKSNAHIDKSGYLMNLYYRATEAMDSINLLSRSSRREERLIVDLGKRIKMDSYVSNSGQHLFSGTRCLFTKSKNNDLNWIRDWVRFHVRVQGANALLFYDNASDRYTSEKIIEAVSDIGGLEVVAVVKWPFKWGPHGHGASKWDSDFAQHGILEHARWRFLERAKSVLYQDVDELAVSRRSAFEIAEESAKGAIIFDGRWIENVVVGPTSLAGRTPRHSDFRYYDPQCPPPSPKWCAVPAKTDPSRQWRVHWVEPAEHTREVELKPNLNTAFGELADFTAESRKFRRAWHYVGGVPDVSVAWVREQVGMAGRAPGPAAAGQF